MALRHQGWHAFNSHYYFEGTSGRDHVTIKSGNLLEDISDHLPSYALITSRERSKLQVRPMVRIFSQKILINLLVYC
jgi:hypothetical protein